MDKKEILVRFKAEVDAAETSLTHILKMCEFDEDRNDFGSDTVHDYSVGCLNGAWWMFQRQQAKVEELEQKLDAVKEVMNNLEQEDSAFLIYEELARALKGDSDEN